MGSRPNAIERAPHAQRCDMGVHHRLADVVVPEQLLHGANAQNLAVEKYEGIESLVLLACRDLVNCDHVKNDSTSSAPMVLGCLTP